MPSCSKAAGKVIEQSVNIIDVEGTGMGILSGRVKKLVKLAADIGQNNYPESLGTMWIINSSTFFKMCWAIIKGFIDEKTRNKIHVEKKDYVKKILDVIDAESLPTFLGGKCICSDIEGGCLFSDIGPWNPYGGGMK
jgi:hypothetical protein